MSYKDDNTEPLTPKQRKDREECRRQEERDELVCISVEELFPDDDTEPLTSKQRKDREKCRRLEERDELVSMLLKYIGFFAVMYLVFNLLVKGCNL